MHEVFDTYVTILTRVRRVIVLKWGGTTPDRVRVAIFRREASPPFDDRNYWDPRIAEVFATAETNTDFETAIEVGEKDGIDILVRGGPGYSDYRKKMGPGKGPIVLTPFLPAKEAKKKELRSLRIEGLPDSGAMVGVFDSMTMDELYVGETYSGEEIPLNISVDTEVKVRVRKVGILPFETTSILRTGCTIIHPVITQDPLAS